MSARDRYSLSKAVLFIFLFTLMVSGSGTLGWFYYRHICEKRLHDDRFTITSIIETHKGEALPPGYLAQILYLNYKTNLYRFSALSAGRALRADPFFRKAEVKKVYPDKIWVDYQTRKPIAVVDDFTNTVIDADGVLFAKAPLFEKKNLPSIYLGIGNLSGKIWGTKVKTPAFELGTKIFEFFKKNFESNTLEKIDVADAYAASFGKRQIILVLKEAKGSQILRLPTDNYQIALANYQVLRSKILQNETAEVIDLRIPHLAFLKTQGSP